jgi:uncharacterized membrane protein YkoI
MKNRMPIIVVIAAVCVMGLIVASVSTFADLLAENNLKNSPSNSTENIGTTNEYIGEEAAKEIVLAKVPGATIENITEFYLENDEGKVKYDGELYFENMKYEFLINAVDGTMLEWDQENNKSAAAVDTTINNNGNVVSVKPVGNGTVNTSTYIGIAKVKEILLFRVPGAIFGTIDLEYDDGKVKYEGEMYLNSITYKFEINAVTGAILDWESDASDDVEDITDAAEDTTDASKDANEDAADAREDAESND